MKIGRIKYTDVEADARIAIHTLVANAHHIKTIDASELTAGILALARLSGITNTEIAAAAGIVESKLALAQGTQALFNKIGTDIATHAALATGIHGVGASTIASLLDLATHAALPNAHHTIAAGTFTGNDADDRQITTGFKCSMVIVLMPGGTTTIGVLTPDESFCIGAAAGHCPGASALHATDGFIVEQTNDNLNENTIVIAYWAISE